MQNWTAESLPMLINGMFSFEQAMFLAQWTSLYEEGFVIHNWTTEPLPMLIIWIFSSQLTIGLLHHIPQPLYREALQCRSEDYRSTINADQILSSHYRDSLLCRSEADHTPFDSKTSHYREGSLNQRTTTNADHWNVVTCANHMPSLSHVSHYRKGLLCISGLQNSYQSWPYIMYHKPAITESACNT